MAGKKDESLNSKNVFAALSSLRKKKKSEKEKNGSSNTDLEKKGIVEKKVFWAPAPLTVKSWADVDDEDDDDYYATTAPPVPVWGGDTLDSKQEKEDEAVVEVLLESESEVEGLDEVDDDVEEDHENEHELEAPVFIKKPPEESTRKESERQLSKKELKKKGLQELDAVLAELGYNKQETSSQDDFHVVQEKKTENDREVEKKGNAHGESKSSKKKKKKEKTSKEAKESHGQPHDEDVGNGIHETAETEQVDDAPAVDVKARLKKVASAKKKKSSRETDAAARAAASEAAARNAKLAAAKKKEKNHYNQQPVR
ncbi:histone-lysine N-methyltransferase SETD1B isoform X1 [Ricinus communis]|uniref:histone-lysine N-methyltransferase SETD1B isoform X1 n=1 Tax=Ricinus communis TaxID=3988 RepID=UPI0007729F5D|nr:histone-lysine N-methyltransferase SETD1B isoform X1 [Ricinus communis]|eukprot:XP_015572580.1 histone-lysine N-methyltransferase SETD1B isoform X1 [Ricinus communis]